MNPDQNTERKMMYEGKNNGGTYNFWGLYNMQKCWLTKLSLALVWLFQQGLFGHIHQTQKIHMVEEVVVLGAYHTHKVINEGKNMVEKIFLMIQKRIGHTHSSLYGDTLLIISRNRDQDKTDMEERDSKKKKGRRRGEK